MTPLTLTAWADEVLREFEEVRRLEEKATKGPWRVGWSKDDAENSRYILRTKGLKSKNPDDWTVVVSGCGDSWDIPQGVLDPKDANLIAAARNFIPRLAAQLAKLPELVERVKRLELNLYTASETNYAMGVRIAKLEAQAKEDELTLRRIACRTHDDGRDCGIWDLATNRLSAREVALKAGEEKG